jgi:predicted kinase
VGLDGTAISEAEWRKTYAEACARVEEHLCAGRSVLFDHGNFSRAERDTVRASALGAPVRFIYVGVDQAEARRRLLANRQTREREDVRDENFVLAHRQLEELRLSLTSARRKRNHHWRCCWSVGPRWCANCACLCSQLIIVAMLPTANDNALSKSFAK